MEKRAAKAQRKQEKVEPDAQERKVVHKPDKAPAAPAPEQRPDGEPDLKVVRDDTPSKGQAIWAGRAMDARDREIAERDRFTYRRPPGAGGAGLVDDPAPRGTHHERSLKDTAQRRHDDAASDRYQQGLVERHVAARRKEEWDAQVEPRRIAPPGKSRRADLNDSQWDIDNTQVPATGRHAAERKSMAGDMVSNDDLMAGSPAARQAWGKAKNRGGTGVGGDIQSMRDDFPRVIAQGQQVIDDAVTSMRQQVSASVAESPSHQSVKDATDKWAEEMAALAARGDDIIALSRQADQTGYDAAEQYGADPNRHAWMD